MSTILYPAWQEISVQTHQVDVARGTRRVVRFVIRVRQRTCQWMTWLDEEHHTTRTQQFESKAHNTQRIFHMTQYVMRHDKVKPASPEIARHVVGEHVQIEMQHLLLVDI